MAALNQKIRVWKLHIMTINYNFQERETSLSYSEWLLQWSSNGAHASNTQV